MIKSIPVACSQGADIAPFPADDPAFHFIVGQLHHRHGGFGHVIRGAR